MYRKSKYPTQTQTALQGGIVDPCPSCGGYHGDVVGCRAGTLDAINTMLDRHRANRVVKNDFQEGVMAALLMLNVEITREQFDELMIAKAGEYADGRVPV